MLGLLLVAPGAWAFYATFTDSLRNMSIAIALMFIQCVVILGRTAQLWNAYEKVSVPMGYKKDATIPALLTLSLVWFCATTFALFLLRTRMANHPSKRTVSV